MQQLHVGNNLFAVNNVADAEIALQDVLAQLHKGRTIDVAGFERVAVLWQTKGRAQPIADITRSPAHPDAPVVAAVEIHDVGGSLARRHGTGRQAEVPAHRRAELAGAGRAQ